VRPRGDGYEIVEGGHRFSAGLEAGLDEFPCLVKKMTDSEVLVIQLKCQAVRPKETAKYEYSRRMKKLMEGGMSLPELCKTIGKSPEWVKVMLQLVRLCETAIMPVNRGEISLKKAFVLSKLPMVLQENFVEDAPGMKSDDFVSRVTEAKRDYESFVSKGEFADKLQGAQPKIRTALQIITEGNTLKNADVVIPAYGATTPLEGWKACLSWLMRLDPITVQRKRDGIAEEQAVVTDLHTYRKQKRELIRNLVSDIS
jgi:ParB/RepB/Spo0J family partition protein